MQLSKLVFVFGFSLVSFFVLLCFCFIFGYFLIQFARCNCHFTEKTRKIQFKFKCKEQEVSVRLGCVSKFSKVKFAHTKQRRTPNITGTHLVEANTKQSFAKSECESGVRV